MPFRVKNSNRYSLSKTRGIFILYLCTYVLLDVGHDGKVSLIMFARISYILQCTFLFRSIFIPGFMQSGKSMESEFYYLCPRKSGKLAIARGNSIFMLEVVPHQRSMKICVKFF